jgi:hypothetical protein
MGMKKCLKNYVGEHFLYENQTWLCTRYIGVDMFEFEHEVTKEKITVPYTWGKFIMDNIENEIKEIHEWIIENRNKIEVSDFKDNRILVSEEVHDLYVKVMLEKDTKSNLFRNYYDIVSINGVRTNGRYKKHSKLIKEIWKTLVKISEEQSNNREGKQIRKEIDKIVSISDYDEKFEFGEPRHKDNLPGFELEVGKTYLVPMKLLEKDRRFDGGRLSEYYEFHYTTGVYGYRPFSIPDYHMTKEILEFDKKKLDNNV